MLSESDIAAFKERHPLLEFLRSRGVELQRIGVGVHKGKCPFHIEDTASFHVNAGDCPIEDRRHTYHCFGCGAHGDILKWLEEVDALKFMEAIRHLDGGTLQPLSAPQPVRASVKAEIKSTRMSESRWARWCAACDRLAGDEAQLTRIAAWRGYSREIIVNAANHRLMGLWDYMGATREAFLITAPARCTIGGDGWDPVPVGIHVRLAPHTPGNPDDKQRWNYDPKSTPEQPVKSWPFLWGNPIGAKWLFPVEGQWDAMALADGCGWRSPEDLPHGCAIIGLRGAGGVRRFLEDFPFLDRASAICIGDNDRAGESWHDEGGFIETLQNKIATVVTYRPAEKKDLNDLLKLGLFHGPDFLDMVRARLRPDQRPPKRETFLQWCRLHRDREDALGRAARFVLNDDARPRGRKPPRRWEAHWEALAVPEDTLNDLRTAMRTWNTSIPEDEMPLPSTSNQPRA